MATNKEQEDLLNMKVEEIGEPTHKPRQLDVHGDTQRYLANPDSQYEVSVGGTVISGPEEEQDFDKALKLYDKCIRHHDASVIVTHILNGTRTVILRSPVVKYKDKPKNRIPIRYEDDNDTR